MNADSAKIQLAVVGAHLRGQPLNHQLTNLGAGFMRTTLTSPFYRLYALQKTDPPKPGLIRVKTIGAEIKVEIWHLPTKNFGVFIKYVSEPLCIGTIELKDGDLVKGFLCEAHAISDARDISEFGGWIAYLDKMKSL